MCMNVLWLIIFSFIYVFTIMEIFKCRERWFLNTSLSISARYHKWNYKKKNTFLILVCVGNIERKWKRHREIKRNDKTGRADTKQWKYYCWWNFLHIQQQHQEKNSLVYTTSQSNFQKLPLLTSLKKKACTN